MFLRVHEITARSREIVGSTLFRRRFLDDDRVSRVEKSRDRARPSVDIVANGRKTTISSRASGGFAYENEIYSDRIVAHVLEISVPSLQEKRVIHSPYALTLNDLSIDSERPKAVLRLGNAFYPIYA